MNQKVGRNDPCPCGSGKKYKNCCMNKEEASKKVYTSTGKRKFKAKVIDSNLGSQEIFSQAAGNVPTANGSSDVFKKLRFRMSDHDYRAETKEDAPVVSTPFEQPKPAAQPLAQSGQDFNASTDDFRVEKK
ncbi:MAG: SEC-C domain-containing protein [Verrucomicrobia bacterium]|nr:SEC-C domain-containing protein [Verrucomicrobiota bacterium]MBS0645795.1 SEC-C domain-containing protein [Verrucomicrobiota bacterium]